MPSPIQKRRAHCYIRYDVIVRNFCTIWPDLLDPNITERSFNPLEHQLAFEEALVSVCPNVSVICYVGAEIVMSYLQ